MRIYSISGKKQVAKSMNFRKNFPERKEHQPYFGMRRNDYHSIFAVGFKNATLSCDVHRGKPTS